MSKTNGNNKRVVQTTTNQIIDHETGEVIRTSNTEVTSREAEPPFVKLYIQDVSRLMDLPPSSSKLLTLLLKSMGYNNVVVMYKPIKEMMCEELGIRLNTLNDAVKLLHRKGILIRKARGVYVIDPEQFGRGKWEDIKKIRMTVEYDEEQGKRISTELVKQLELSL